MSDDGTYETQFPLPTPREREILIILIEECAEVQQAATKLLRFGADDCKPGQELTNMERLCEELGDLHTVIAMAIDNDIVDSELIKDRMPIKNKKLKKYMQTKASRHQ